MPESYTMESLPTPKDTSIRFHKTAEKKIAVITFDGYTTEKRVNNHRSKLFAQLQTS
jgi:hypothetical protein